jgi:hypothetical protein
MRKSRLKYLGIATTAAAVLSGCNDDNSAGILQPPANAPQNFSAFATSTFEQPANSTPVSVDGVVIVDDVGDDPNAFNALLMM